MPFSHCIPRRIYHSEIAHRLVRRDDSRFSAGEIVTACEDLGRTPRIQEQPILVHLLFFPMQAAKILEEESTLRPRLGHPFFRGILSHRRWIVLLLLAPRRRDDARRRSPPTELLASRPRPSPRVCRRWRSIRHHRPASSSETRTCFDSRASFRDRAVELAPPVTNDMRRNESWAWIVALSKGGAAGAAGAASE